MKNNLVQKLQILTVSGCLLVSAMQLCFANSYGIKVDMPELVGNFAGSEADLFSFIGNLKLGTYKLLNVECGYNDKDLESRVLSFADLGVCNPERPKWQVVDKQLPEGEKEILVLYPYDGFLYMGGDSGIFKTKDDGKTWIRASGGLPREAAVLTLQLYDGFLYAGTYNHGIYKTNDGGSNWLKVNSESIKSAIKVLYSFNGCLYISCLEGMYKTNDGGKTWIKAGNGLSDATVVVLQAHDAALYAGTTHGVFKSIDGGESWVKVTKDASVSSLYSYDGHLYAIIKKVGLFKTNDGGKGWVKINENPRLESVRGLFSANNYLYAVTEDGGIFKTNDAGEDWTVVTSDGFKHNTDNYKVSVDSFLVKLQHDDILYAVTSDHKLLKSVDNGKKWDHVYIGLSVNSVYGMSLYGEYLFIATDGGIFKNKSGKNWVLVNGSWEWKAAYSIQLHEGELYVGGSDRIFKTNDGGENWIKIDSRLPGWNDAIALHSHDGYLYASMRRGGVFKTNDKGMNWLSAEEGFVKSDLIFVGPESVVDFYSHLNSLYAITSEHKLYLTNTDETKWVLIKPNHSFEMVAGIYGNDQCLYVLTRDGKIFKTTNSGKDWILVCKDIGTQMEMKQWFNFYRNDEQSSEEIYPSQTVQFYKDSLYTLTNKGIYKNDLVLGSLQFLTPTPPHAGYLYHGTDGGIFHANDGAASWGKMNNGFKVGYHGGVTGLWIKSLQSHKGYLYAATEYGIYRTNDNGKSWQQVANEKQVNALYSNGGYLYAGVGFGKGALRSEDGISWFDFAYGLDSYASIEDICVFGNYLYVAGWRGIYRKHNAEGRWKKIDFQIEAVSLKVHGDYLYVGSRNNGVFKTKDGITWTEVNNEELKGSEKETLYSLDDYLYVRTEEGMVLKTNDGGNNWTRVKNIVKNDNITSLYLHDGYLFAGTILQGIFRTKEKVITVNKHEDL